MRGSCAAPHSPPDAPPEALRGPDRIFGIDWIFGRSLANYHRKYVSVCLKTCPTAASPARKNAKTAWSSKSTKSPTPERGNDAPSAKPSCAYHSERAARCAQGDRDVPRAYEPSPQDRQETRRRFSPPSDAQHGHGDRDADRTEDAEGRDRHRQERG